MLSTLSQLRKPRRKSNAKEVKLQQTSGTDSKQPEPSEQTLNGIIKVPRQKASRKGPAGKSVLNGAVSQLEPQQKQEADADAEAEAASDAAEDTEEVAAAAEAAEAACTEALALALSGKPHAFFQL